MLFLVYSFVIPYFFIDSLWRIAAINLIYWSVVSYNFCLIFATNHLTECSVFPNQETKTRDWATLQVMTSSNYATSSTLWTWISGGLNFQIEHHVHKSITSSHLFLFSYFLASATSTTHRFPQLSNKPAKSSIFLM